MSRHVSTLLLIAPAFLAAGLASCAPTASHEASSATSSPRQCFYSRQVTSFRGDDQTLYVRTQNRDVFELQSLGYCNDLDFSLTIAFLPGVMDRLCAGDTTRIIASGGPAPQTPCRVRVIKKLTYAEIVALPDRNRP